MTRVGGSLRGVFALALCTVFLTLGFAASVVRSIDPLPGPSSDGSLDPVANGTGDANSTAFSPLATGSVGDSLYG